MESFEKVNIDSKEIEKLKEPQELSYDEFVDQYEKVMQSVAEKEKRGKLDPNSQPYEPISLEEQHLLEKDWKEFSRQRGFSEDDIQEYERWLTLSGQRDNLAGAINDPWRRNRFEHAKSMYIKHIENAIANGKEISPEILNKLEELKKSNRRVNIKNNVPMPGAGDPNTGEDLW